MVDFKKALKEKREMATKKTSSKTAMVKWDAELAAMAEMATGVEKNVGASGNVIKTGGGVLMYNGAKIPGNAMKVVVIDHVIAYSYFEDEYDADNPQSPVCFAFGRDEKTIAPVAADVADLQNATCVGCPQNEWASAAKGRGKACKNGRKLAIIVEGDLDDIAAGEVAYINVPVTSVRSWAGYVRQIAEVMKRPPLGVITKISLENNPKGGFDMNFELVSEIEDSEQIGALIEKRKGIQKEIIAPYVYINNVEEKPKKGSKKAPAKKAPAKKAKF